VICASRPAPETLERILQTKHKTPVTVQSWDGSQHVRDIAGEVERILADHHPTLRPGLEEDVLREHLPGSA
jgi:hypothetical protein